MRSSSAGIVFGFIMVCVAAAAYDARNEAANGNGTTASAGGAKDSAHLASARTAESSMAAK